MGTGQLLRKPFLFTLGGIEKLSIDVKLIEFSLNVFIEFTEFSDKNICHNSKRDQTCQLLC